MSFFEKFFQLTLNFTARRGCPGKSHALPQVLPHPLGAASRCEGASLHIIKVSETWFSEKQ